MLADAEQYVVPWPGFERGLDTVAGDQWTDISTSAMLTPTTSLLSAPTTSAAEATQDSLLDALGSQPVRTSLTPQKPTMRNRDNV